MANQSIETALKAGTDALSHSAAGSTAAFQELTKAYQELAARNAKNLADAIQALSSVKNPSEFIEVQQKLIKDGVQAAVNDSQNIAHLTAAVFTAAFEPVKQQIEAVQKSVRT
jgi:phasin family protein